VTFHRNKRRKIESFSMDDVSTGRLTDFRFKKVQ
jgi:hypothetical protein